MCGCCPNSAPQWSFAEAVTPSDITDNIKNVLYLHNSGAAGDVPILFENGIEVTLYLRQGEFVRGGRWKRVKSTGLGAGVEIVALS
jgi:hypothetical protein